MPKLKTKKARIGRPPLSLNHYRNELKDILSMKRLSAKRLQRVYHLRAKIRTMKAAA